MKDYTLFTILKNAFFLLLIGFVGISCSNSASSKDEVHEEAEGFVLKMNGEIIVEKLPHQSLKNSFPPLKAGEETELIQTFFLDQEGHEFLPDEPGVSLKLELSESGIINLKQTDEEPWGFRVEAIAEGTAKLTLKLMHYDHPDFESPAITIQISPNNFPTKDPLSN